MKKPDLPRTFRTLICLALFCGCGQATIDEPSSGRQTSEASDKSGTSKAAVVVEHQGASWQSGAPAKVATTPANDSAVSDDEPLREPATVEEAAAAIDLSTLPLAPGAEDLKMRR